MERKPDRADCSVFFHCGKDFFLYLTSRQFKFIELEKLKKIERMLSTKKIENLLLPSRNEKRILKESVKIWSKKDI